MLRFHVDRCTIREIVGWIDDNGPVQGLEIGSKGSDFGPVFATLYRADLERAGFGDGRRGFRLSALSLHPGDELTLRRAGRAVTLIRIGEARGDGTLDCAVEMLFEPGDPTAHEFSLPVALVVGFSHTDGLRRAEQNRRLNSAVRSRLYFINFNRPERYQPLAKPNASGIRLYNPTIREDMEALITSNKPKAIFASLWSNHHFLVSTVNNPRPFDFILPTDLDRKIDGNAEVIPYDLVYKMMAERCAMSNQMIPFFRTFTTLPIFSLSAPPPVEHVEMIPGGTSDQRLDAEIRELGVAPAELRFKIWRVCEAIFRASARAYSASFVEAPVEAIDARGFRLPTHFGKDWLHAPASYGELVLRQIDQILAQIE